jgi:transaldolase
MKIFIDSADIDEIRQAYSSRMADGVTTNPTLVKKAVEKMQSNGKNIDMRKYLNEILKIAKGTPVSLEVTKTDALGMIEEGKKLFKIFNSLGNVNIKIPVNPAFSENDANQFDGISAVRALSRLKIPVNCTLIFTPEQALLAAKAGASFVSPFAGRIDDKLRIESKKKFDKKDYYPMNGLTEKNKMIEDNGVSSGIDLVAQCVEILENYRFRTQVIAASIRNPRQARECALVGAHIATLPYDVIKKMLMHQKTYEGMKSFTGDIVKEYADL